MQGGREAASPADACEKLAKLTGAAWSPADRDRCLASYSQTGPSVRACTDACLKKATALSDFEDCHDDCEGTVYPAAMVCQKITSEGQAFDTCTKGHEQLRTAQPDVYTCWSRGSRFSRPLALL